MADRELKSITFPGLPDRYVVPETVIDATLTESGQAADAKAVGDRVSTIEAKLITVVTVSGRDPVIVAEENHRYICGEVDTISFTPCNSGICDVVFTSGTTPAVLTLPGTVRLPDWFNPGTMDASTTYEINVMDGTLGAASAWV